MLNGRFIQKAVPRLLVLEPVHLGQLQLGRPYLLDDGSYSNTEAPVIPHRDEQAFEPVLAVQRLHLVSMLRVNQNRVRRGIFSAYHSA